MFRYFPGALALALLSTSAIAQTPTQRFQPIPGPMRDAGTLHLPDGTWTRKAGTAALGNDVLYDNTCTPTFYSSLSGDTFVDEGRIPGPATPPVLDTIAGCATSYSIDGFQIAYCSDSAAASFNVAFFDTYTACSSVIGDTPVAAFALTGLPGGGSGVASCWVVTIDTAAMPFALDSSGVAPQFGFSIGSTVSSLQHGPTIAGDLASCARGSGTSWDTIPNLAESGTGIGTQDLFFIESGPTTAGCYFFGGNPFGSFFLELYGTTCAPDADGQSAFCYAGGPNITACPCGNTPPASEKAGCRNSHGAAAKLTGTGNARISADTVVLHGELMTPESPVLYFQGTMRQQTGFGDVFGDGLRCAGGSVTRLGIAINSAMGTSQYPAAGQLPISTRGGITSPGSRYYQTWYRDAGNFCTPAAFNTSNGWEIFWGA